MSISEIKSLLNIDSIYIYLSPVIFLVCCVIIWLFVRFLLKDNESSRIKKIIKDISIDYVKNAVLPAAVPDDVNDYVFIDYIALTSAGILVISAQDYKGFLFGGEQTNEWTQMIGHKSYRFNNPLPIIEHHVQSIKNFTGGVPIHSRIVFSSLGEFPKGIPEGVSTANNFKQDVESIVVGNSVSESFRETWDDLLAVVKESNKKCIAK